MSEKEKNVIGKLIEKVAKIIGADPEFNHNREIDAEKDIVYFRYPNGYTHPMRLVDLEDYATLGSTN